MARPREFDKADVIALAAELFRRKGYQATSMRDLITHLGLSSSSIYGAFGGKYGLFMAALKHGAEQDKAMVVRALEHPDGLLAGLTALYQGLIDSLLGEDEGSASLTLRAALESLDAAAAASSPDAGAPRRGGSGAGSRTVTPAPDVLDAMRTHFADLAAVVAERLEAAQGRGELRLKQDASDLALFILLNAFNLTVVVKLTRDPERLAAYVRAALDSVADPP